MGKRSTTRACRGESFPDEAVFEDFYAGRPLDADDADAADASPVPDAVPLGVVTADAGANQACE